MKDTSNCLKMIEKRAIIYSNYGYTVQSRPEGRLTKSGCWCCKRNL